MFQRITVFTSAVSSSLGGVFVLLYSCILPLFHPLFSSIFLCSPLWVRIAHLVLIRVQLDNHIIFFDLQQKQEIFPFTEHPYWFCISLRPIFSGYQEHFSWLKSGQGMTLTTQPPFNGKDNEWCCASIHPYTAMACTETNFIFFASSYSLSYSFSFPLIFSSTFLFSFLSSSLCFPSHLYIQDLKVLWKNERIMVGCK